MEIKILEQEYWWGGMIDQGCRMPYSAETTCKIDLRQGGSDQISPLFLSSKGRILYSDKPYELEFKSGSILIGDEYDVEYTEGLENLKGAHKKAAEKYFGLGKGIPDEIFFRVPQYNTWIELMYNQNQKQILEYAHAIVDSGMTPGILMIDEGWSEDYGVFDFYPGRFEDPIGMVEELHELGFIVMLWITPHISPDGATFRELWHTDYLIREQNGNLALREWWNGYSCILDLSNPDAVQWFKGKLDGVMEKYKVDGFKFDAGGSHLYSDTDLTFVRHTARDNTKDFDTFAAKYRFNELRAVWNMGGEPLVCRLQDKVHSWDEEGLQRIVPDTLMQGLMGYYYGCPDMIGGGSYAKFLEPDFKLDEELYLRWLEASVLCPMMQFSIAPWRVLSEESFSYVKAFSKFREQYADYIISLAKHASEAGEPIVRHLAYEFPEEGFELVNDLFMLGDKYLVVPMLQQGEDTRTIRLPGGKWKVGASVVQGGTEISLKYAADTLHVLERVEEA